MVTLAALTPSRDSRSSANLDSRYALYLRSVVAAVSLNPPLTASESEYPSDEILLDPSTSLAST